MHGMLAALLSGLAMVVGVASLIDAETPARDPGVRTDVPAAGGPLPGLGSIEQAFFEAGLNAFLEAQSVQGTVPNTEAGLGPRFNLDSCAGCHAQPATGGSSPAVNPQVAVATKLGARNSVPFFVKQYGPVREARFRFKPDGSRDGGVQNLYTISGRLDAPGCRIAQPDFDGAAQANNLTLRIPTPVFGLGLVEAIPDSAILYNMNAAGPAKRALGISGRPNRNGNDGTITRFGWKAQNPSLEIFAGEAYNVEQGVTNEMFPQEREGNPSCRFNPTPESRTHFDATTLVGVPSDVAKFAMFMRFLAPPAPAPDTPSTARGRALFGSVGCAYCHTPALRTGASGFPALDNQPVPLYSDLLLHSMGARLADEILQNDSGPTEFRTAPLWGLGQRIFFLHDGRTRDLLEAIRFHASGGTQQYPPSEANRVIANFESLTEAQKQDLLNFLRSL